MRLEAALRTRWDRDWLECPQSVSDWKPRGLCGPKPPPAPFKLTQLPPQILHTAVYAELPFYLACLWKCCELIKHVPKKHDPVFMLTRQDNCCTFGSWSFGHSMLTQVLNKNTDSYFAPHSLVTFESSLLPPGRH